MKTVAIPIEGRPKVAESSLNLFGHELFKERPAPRARVLGELPILIVGFIKGEWRHFDIKSYNLHSKSITGGTYADK